MPGTRRRLPGSTRRKVGTTSSHHAPYVQGCKHATMAGTKGRKPARVSQSQKAGLSSDRGLQLDPVKSESLVIADQQRCGEYVPGPCTHRPSRPNRQSHLRPLPPLRVGPWASGVTDFRDVTGGVYKARERIHRSVADLRLLATPTSWGRVADPNPN